MQATNTTTLACRCWLLFACLSGFLGCRTSLEQQVIGADTLMVVFYAPQRDTLLVVEKEYINAFSSRYLSENILDTRSPCLPEGEMVFLRKGKPKAQVYFSLACRQYTWLSQAKKEVYQITEEGVEFLALAQQWGKVLPTSP